MYVEVGDKQYELAGTLRVAYKVQGQHNHKPYSQVFSGINSMTLEQQVGIVYSAFCVANPEDAKTIKEKDFLEYFLDNYNVGQLMDMLSYIIENIMGKDLVEETKEREKANPQ